MAGWSWWPPDESGHVVAFIDLQPDGHIDRLFCAPEAAGRGVASRLYDAIETAARAQGIGRLFTEASELARRSFERKGFTALERQDDDPPRRAHPQLPDG